MSTFIFLQISGETGTDELAAGKSSPLVGHFFVKCEHFANLVISIVHFHKRQWRGD